jgi:hypothetical protein
MESLEQRASLFVIQYNEDDVSSGGKSWVNLLVGHDKRSGNFKLGVFQL